MQVSFKFIFPQGTIPEDTFRQWTSISKQSLEKWEYEYEWTNGILLRQELVRIDKYQISVIIFLGESHHSSKRALYH